MKEIVLYEDEDEKEIATIKDDYVYLETFDKSPEGAMYLTDSYIINIDKFKKIYHAIEEEE